MHLNVGLVAFTAVVLGACASTPKPSYVSPTQYQSLSCQQLQSEYNRIHDYIQNGVETPKRTGRWCRCWPWWWLGQPWRCGHWSEYFGQYGTIFKYQTYRTFTRSR